MFVAIVSYKSVGGYNKVPAFLANEVNGRRVAFDSADAALEAAEETAEGLPGQGLKTNGYTITLVDLSNGTASQSGTAVVQTQIEEEEPESTTTYVVA